MPATAIACPHPTIFTHENIFWQVVTAKFTLQAPLIPPRPLRVPMMLTSDVFVIKQVLHRAIKSASAGMRIGIRGHLVLNRLVSLVKQLIGVPELTTTRFPLLAADVAKLPTTSGGPREYGVVVVIWKAGAGFLTHRHVIWLHPCCSSTIVRQWKQRCQFAALAMASTFCKVSSRGQSSSACSRDRQGRCVFCWQAGQVP